MMEMYIPYKFDHLQNHASISRKAFKMFVANFCKFKPILIILVYVYLWRQTVAIFYNRCITNTLKPLMSMYLNDSNVLY